MVTVVAAVVAAVVVAAVEAVTAEVEDVVAQHPSVAEVGAIGVPDEKSGEAVKVVVVKRAGAALEADELVTFCRTKLAAYKVPRVVEFRAELPKTNVGKILRRALR